MARERFIPVDYSRDSQWSKLFAIRRTDRYLPDIQRGVFVAQALQDPHFPSFGFEGIDEEGASLQASGLINERLLEGKTVVIDSGRLLTSIGLVPLRGRKLQIIEENRAEFPTRLPVTTIAKPEIVVIFHEGECSIDIYGIKNGGEGEDKSQEQKVFSISSEDGEISPRGFLVATEKEVLFGKVDHKGFFACALEYQKGFRWIVELGEGK